MIDPQSPVSTLHKGLYEVHLSVRDLDCSVDFYVAKLGFEVGLRSPDGQSALLVYSDGTSRWMLGLFRVGAIAHRHPAEYHVSFRVPAADVDRMIPFLRERNIEPVHPSTSPVRGRMTEPIVHGWMPAAAVFFQDPDGHLLELIAELPDDPRPDFVYRPLSEWRGLQESGP